MDKILIAEPIYGAVPPEVYFNRIAFWRTVWANDEPQAFYTPRSMVMGPRRGIRSARAEAIDAAIQNGATHLFFMDDDILVPPHILDVLRRLDKPIAGGLIHNDDGSPIVFRDIGDGNGGIGEQPWVNHPKEGAFECAAVGAGCMLIKTEVLILLYGNNEWLFNYDNTERSMDVLFCRMARKAGFSVWCWPDVECEQVRHY